MSDDVDWNLLIQLGATVGMWWYALRAIAHMNRNRPIVSKEDDGKYLVRRDLRRTGGRRYH